jgi:hypothetical protein
VGAEGLDQHLQSLASGGVPARSGPKRAEEEVRRRLCLEESLRLMEDPGEGEEEFEILVDRSVISWWKFPRAQLFQGRSATAEAERNIRAETMTRCRGTERSEHNSEPAAETERNTREEIMTKCRETARSERNSRTGGDLECNFNGGETERKQTPSSEVWRLSTVGHVPKFGHKRTGRT